MFNGIIEDAIKGAVESKGVQESIDKLVTGELDKVFVRLLSVDWNIVIRPGIEELRKKLTK